MGLVVWCLALLVLIIVDSVILAGKTVVMDSLPGLGRVPRSLSYMSSSDFLIILLGLHVLCLQVLFSFGIVATRFACRAPTWRLPMPGHVARLVAVNSRVVQEVMAEGVGHEVQLVSVSGPGRKRSRLDRTTSAHLAGLLLQSRPRVWKRLCHVEHSFDSIPDRKREAKRSG